MNRQFRKIIIDGNNIFYKCYFVALSILERSKKPYTSKQVYSEAVSIFLSSVTKLQREVAFIDSEFYFLWDNPTSKKKLQQSMDSSLLKRKELDPEYKNNRVQKDKSFYHVINYLRLLLSYKSSRYYDLQIEMMEADDLLSSLLNYFKSIDQYKDILIVSEDLDWSRGIDIENNILWYAKKKVYDAKEFHKKYRFYPTKERIIMYKTFRGDNSDNIPNAVKNLKEDVLLEIIEQYKDIYTFLQYYETDDYISPKMKEKVKNNRHRLRLNYQLVEFIDIDISVVKSNLIQGEKNETKLIKLCQSLDILTKEFKKQKVTANNFLRKRSKFKRD